MKPFNLSEALAGKRIITKDGQKVTELTRFSLTQKNCLIGVIDNTLYSWTIDGKFTSRDESRLDLFMVSESKFLWINLWQQLHENGNYKTTVHTREDLADLEIENNVTLKHIQKLTIIL
jgi:hypothetical protein